eukprot:1960635-Prymnesium_polylepis.1
MRLLLRAAAAAAVAAAGGCDGTTTPPGCVARDSRGSGVEESKWPARERCSGTRRRKDGKGSSTGAA